MARIVRALRMASAIGWAGRAIARCVGGVLERRRSRTIGGVCLALVLASYGCRNAPDTIAEPGVLRFWNGFTGPDGATMERIVRAFERDSGVRVKMQIIPWATYYDKLTLSLAYGGAPDVFICHANRLAEFARYGVMRPMDDLLGATGIEPADMLPNVLKAARYDGVPYGIPLDCHPQGLYYNRKLFRQAGLVGRHGEPRPPGTLDQFLDAARRLTRDTTGDGRPDQWGFAFTWLRTNWITFISQSGGSILTRDLSASAIASPANVVATRQMGDLISRYRVAPRPEGFDSWMGFRQGRVAMAIEGIYMLSSLEEQRGLDYAGAPVPAFGPRRAVWGGSHVLCLPDDLPRDRVGMAARFIRYLSDHSLDWAAGGQLPVRRSLLNHPRFRAMRVQKEFARQLPYVVFEPASHKSTEIMPFYDAAIESALLGIQTPEAALAEADRRIGQVMARP
jgi:multiple sugar transport system substrate-binding protein